MKMFWQKKERKLVKDLEKLLDSVVTSMSLKPGDVIVIYHPGHLSSSALSAIRDFIEDRFPDNKAMVLEEGMKIGKISIDK